MSDTGEANRARERGNPGRARALTDRDPPLAGAASVSRRWWEEAASPGSMPLIASTGPESASPAAEVPPPPPPPPPRRSSAKPSHLEQAKMERIKRMVGELFEQKAIKDWGLSIEEAPVSMQTQVLPAP